jgi:hypothetical protein
MQLGVIITNEINQTQKDKYCMVPTYVWSLKKVKLIEAQVEWWPPEAGLGLGGKGWLERSWSKGTNFQL